MFRSLPKETIQPMQARKIDVDNDNQIHSIWSQGLI